MQYTKLATVLFCLLLPTRGADANRQPNSHVPATKIFKSRKALERGLGKELARQVPASFNFELFALVWIDLPVVTKPTVTIITLPPHNAYASKFSAQIEDFPSLHLSVARKTRMMYFEYTPDPTPCLGGIPKPPKEQKACARQMAARHEVAKRTLRLFATPRFKLKSIRVTRKNIPRRP